MATILKDLRNQPNENKVVIYGSKDCDHAKAFITRMLNSSQKNTSISSATPSRPIELDSDQQISTWKLATKYYDALLSIRLISYEDIEPESQLAQVQAVVILWGNDKKDHLASVLQSLSSSPCDSRLVIVDLESEELLEDLGWQELCAEHGFESYVWSDVDAASMSWQCCPWPSIKSHSKSSSSNLVQPAMELQETPLNQHPSLLQDAHSQPFCEKASQNDDKSTLEDHQQHESRNFPTVGNQTHSIHHDEQPSKNGAELDGFEEEFTEFTSAESSKKLEDEESTLDDEEISELEVDKMVHQIFGLQDPNLSSQAEPEALGDLECLVAQIDRLKLQAASMDPRSRKRFAACAAMAIEKHLGPD